MEEKAPHANSAYGAPTVPGHSLSDEQATRRGRPRQLADHTAKLVARS